jgi:hypothetical protein
MKFIDQGLFIPGSPLKSIYNPPKSSPSICPLLQALNGGIDRGVTFFKFVRRFQVVQKFDKYRYIHLEIKVLTYNQGYYMGTEAKRERKTRSDKGNIMATRRDLYCIAWIAEMYAARGDQIQRLLTRFPDPRRPFKGKLIAKTTVKDQISRWKRAGWIEYKRVLADEPGFCWVTKKGLQLVDLDDIYTAHAPAYTRLDHIYAVNQLRIFLDKTFAWRSERRYRAELEKPKQGEDASPIPDGLITTKEGALIAIEAEISPKKPAVLEEKIKRLTGYYTYTNRGYGPAFPTIWFYVPTDQMKALVEDAIERLRDDDDQKRVSVGVEPQIVASKFR